MISNLIWNTIGEYNRKITWDAQSFKLPEIGQDVLIFFPDTNVYCRKDEYTGNNILSDRYGRVIVGYFYLTGDERVCITDGNADFGYICKGIKWAEFNRPSQPDKQVKMCKNFICKKYDMEIGSRCDERSCNECDEGRCVNCKMYHTQSPNCKNSKIW